MINLVAFPCLISSSQPCASPLCGQLPVSILSATGCTDCKKVHQCNRSAQRFPNQGPPFSCVASIELIICQDVIESDS